MYKYNKPMGRFVNSPEIRCMYNIERLPPLPPTLGGRKLRGKIGILRNVRMRESSEVVISDVVIVAVVLL